MSVHGDITGIYAGSGPTVHKLGIDTTQLYGSHIQVLETNTLKTYVAHCDEFEVVKVQSNIPLSSMVIQDCVTDFVLIETINQVPCHQDNKFVYTFPWKVSFCKGMLNGDIEFKPRHTSIDQTINIVVTIRYNQLSAKDRVEKISKGRQGLTTHSYIVNGKCIDQVVSFPLTNHSRTNGLFVYGVNLDDLEQVKFLFNGNLKVTASVPYIKEVIRKYDDTTFYIPLNANMDPRPDDFLGSIHLGAMHNESLQLTFKPGVDVIYQIEVKTIDVVWTGRHAPNEPSCHPHFVYPQKRKAEKINLHKSSFLFPILFPIHMHV